MNEKEKRNKGFFCPLGRWVMWWRNLVYKECPLLSYHRDMPECKECRLLKDSVIEGVKKDKKVDKPKKRKKNKKDRFRNRGERK